MSCVRAMQFDACLEDCMQQAALRVVVAGGNINYRKAAVWGRAEALRQLGQMKRGQGIGGSLVSVHALHEEARSERSPASPSRSWDEFYPVEDGRDEQIERSQAVQAVLDSMDPEQADLLRGTYMAGRTQEQYARLMGRSPPTIRARLLKARRAFEIHWHRQMRATSPGRLPPPQE